MNLKQALSHAYSRRAFLEKTTLGLGSIALAGLLHGEEDKLRPRNAVGGFADMPHLQPKVKRVIYLFQSGGPSSMTCSTTSPGCIKSLARRCPSLSIPTSARLP